MLLREPIVNNNADLDAEMSRLEASERKVVSSLVEIERRHLEDGLDPAVYRQLRGQYEAKLHWTRDRIQEVKVQREASAQHVKGVMTAREFIVNLGKTLHELNDHKWRELFIRVNFRLRDREGRFLFEADIPALAEETADIVSSKA